jgi:hypothetical protein
MRYKPGQKASVGLCYDDLTDQSLDSQLMAQLQLSVAYASFLAISKSNETHNTSTTMQAVFFSNTSSTVILEQTMYSINLVQYPLA